MSKFPPVPKVPEDLMYDKWCVVKIDTVANTTSEQKNEGTQVAGPYFPYGKNEDGTPKRIRCRVTLERNYTDTGRVRIFAPPPLEEQGNIMMSARHAYVITVYQNRDDERGIVYTCSGFAAVYSQHVEIVCKIADTPR